MLTWERVTARPGMEGTKPCTHARAPSTAARRAADRIILGEKREREGVGEAAWGHHAQGSGSESGRRKQVRGLHDMLWTARKALVRPYLLNAVGPLERGSSLPC
jgi:hypothetical protein